MNKVLEYIAKKSGKSTSEIATLAEEKKDQLSGMITLDGALIIVAQQLNIPLKIKGGVVIMDEEQTNDGLIVDEEVTEIRTKSDEEELSLDDLGKKYIKSPKLNETVEFVLKKIVRSKDIDAVDKSGRKFKTNLTSVDYKIIYVTMNDEDFSPKAWEVIGKVNSICKKLGKISGVELQIKHIKDGMKDKNSDDNYSVKTKIDGTWKSLDRKINNWI